MASVTTWSRLEPVSRSGDLEAALAAEIRDPLWLLARQRQIGEMRGEDTGSPAFVRIVTKATKLVDLTFAPPDHPPVTVPVDPVRPFEAQLLAEPHGADLATRVELGQTFLQILGDAFGAAAGPIRAAFLGVVDLAPPEQVGTQFDPLEESTSAFVAVTAGRAIDGVALLAKARAGEIPGPVQDVLGAGQADLLQKAYTAFVRWVAAAFGEIGPVDPQGWNPHRLDYDITMRFGEGGTTTVAVHPDENGAVDWSSFDVAAQTGDPFSGVATAAVARETPNHVRFAGMPAPRHWDFESGDLPWPDLDVARTELIRLVILDFAMLYGIDWFAAPLDLDVGKAARIESLVVYDVFGGRTLVERVEEARKQQVPDRWTLFSTAAPDGDVASFVIVPPGAGRALEQGQVLEEVRFARDEMANIAWGIEAATPSRTGERRRGAERDAAVDGATPAAPEPPTDAPLRYRVESKVPVNWVPLLVPETQGGAPTTELEKGAVARPGPTPPGGFVAVPALGKILNPTGLTSYRLFDEEVPRSGVRVERVVYRARARDGSTHLWIARRKRYGAGETQSGLRFDAALPTER